MKLAIGSDHAGFFLKGKLLAWLRSAAAGGHRVADVGTFSEASTDYPDIACLVAQAVVKKRASKGILICGTGIGMAMAANKVRGIRAAVVWSPEIAVLAAEHNGANVICLPARYLSAAAVKKVIQAFLRTPFGGGRHARRVRKINQLDRCGR